MGSTKFGQVLSVHLYSKQRKIRYLGNLGVSLALASYQTEKQA